MLNHVVHGTPTDLPPLVIAHGLFGSARNLGVIAKRLSDERQVIAVDMRNHGQSFHDPDHSYAALAADLEDVIGSFGGVADVLGHSMGGKAAMVLALRQASVLRRLIVADIAPVAYAHSQSHLIEAMHAVDLGKIAKRSDADQQLANAVSEPTVRAFLLQSLDLANKTWRLNLDVLDKLMDDITGWPNPPGTFGGPTLFLTGADSDYVTRDARDLIRAQFPSARFAKIPGAGHWLHAEKPREFEMAVRVFLNA